MNTLTQITSTFKFCPCISTYGRGNSIDSEVPIFPATSSKVVCNGEINSRIYAPQNWCKGKETDGKVPKPPLKTTISAQSNTTVFF
jgi:hypothetical protein